MTVFARSDLHVLVVDGQAQRLESTRAALAPTGDTCPPDQSTAASGAFPLP